MKKNLKERWITRAREVFDAEIEGLKSVQSKLDDAFVELVDRAISTVESGGKLVLTGVGKSGHIGCKIAATLASTGTPTVFMHPVEAMHGDLGLLGEKDLLVALSYSGETEELLAVLPAAKRLGVPIVAITCDTDNSLAQWSDLTVCMPVPREACPFNLAPTTSTTALAALGDALALVILDARGFKKDDYAKLHPAGAIGRSITLRVTDVMRSGENLPAVAPETAVREALMEMTRKRAGSVLIVDPENRLLGIFTDGDFRRHVVEDRELMDRSVREVMTEGPTSIRSDAMAVELLNLLEERRIDDIPVVDESGHACGLVDIQDLPKVKLM